MSCVSQVLYWVGVRAIWSDELWDLCLTMWLRGRLWLYEESIPALSAPATRTQQQCFLLSHCCSVEDWVQEGGPRKKEAQLIDASQAAGCERYLQPVDLALEKPLRLREESIPAHFAPGSS